MSFGVRAVFLGVVCVAVATSAQAQGQPRPVVTGVVQDQTGAVLAAATVESGQRSGAHRRRKRRRRTAAGTFRFESVAPGQYELRARYEGFKPAIHEAARRHAARRRRRSWCSARRSDAGDHRQQRGRRSRRLVAATTSTPITIDQNMLESLPVFDNDFVATMSQFLDAGSIGNGGVTIVVNGMEVSALNVSASAMQQIRINQDPYSAEYSRPGRGRVEILTKPGTQQYHGEGTLIFRDAHAQRAQPVRDDQAAGTAADLRGLPRRAARARAARRRSCCRPTTRSRISRRSSTRSGRRASSRTRCRTRAARRGSPAASRGRSATRTRSRSGRTTSTRATRTAASAARRWPARRRTFKHHEQQVTYTQQTILRPTLLNQFQMLVGHEREPTVSASPARGIVVNGAFTGGGGAGRSRAHRNAHQPEREPGVDEGASPDPGRLPAARLEPARLLRSHATSAARSTSPGLDTYAAGRPYAFTQQQGNGDLALLEKQLGTYIKDDWQARAGLSLSFGLRYDWQNYFHDNNNVAPRFSVAYAPGNKKTNVLRAGVGVFNDRSGPVVIADVLHSQPGGLIRYVITNPGYPDPFASAGRRGVAAAEHRPARAGRADSADAAVQRRARSSAAEVADAVAHLHRRARLSPVPLARRQRAAAAALPGAARSGVRRGAAGGIDRPPGDRLAAGDACAARCRAGSTARCSTR